MTLEVGIFLIHILQWAMNLHRSTNRSFRVVSARRWTYPYSKRYDFSLRIVILVYVGFTNESANDVLPRTPENCALEPIIEEYLFLQNLKT